MTNETSSIPSPEQIVEQEATHVDEAIALEMAYAVDSDGVTANSLRTVAAAGRREGVKGVSEELDARANKLEIKAGMAHVAGLRAKASSNFTDMEYTIIGGETVDIPESQEALEQLAAPYIEAMTEKYPRATFELVTNDAGQAWVICADGNGIDFGKASKDHDKARSWNSIMAESEDERFSVAIDGNVYDTRDGMTGSAYEALVAAKKTAGNELPDSKANKLDNGWYAWTLLTGEEADGVYVPIAGVFDDGSVRRDWTSRDSDRRVVRFRPAVKIA